MNPVQFSKLDEREQAELVWDAVQIAERYDDDYHVLLYQIKNLYVEAFYHKEYNYIRKFLAFTKMELLDIYINKIPLEELL